jgi:hypothetical protein
VDLLDSAPALPTGPLQQQDQHRISEVDLTIGKVETMSSDLTVEGLHRIEACKALGETTVPV